MHKTAILLMLAGQLAVTPATTAVAQTQFQRQYATIGVGIIRGGGITLERVIASYGVNLSRNFSLEGQLSRGRDDDVEVINGVTQRIRAGWGYGAFAVLRFPLGSRGGDMFLLAGYENNRLTATQTALPANQDMRGFSYGIGFNLFSGPGGGVRLTYSRIRENEARALTVSYRRQF